MFAIRSKETKKFLKVFNDHPEDETDYQLGFAPAIELNFYMNESAGFVADILMGQSQGHAYAPVLLSDINPHTLEVVDMTDLSIVSIEWLLDGYDEDELPPFQKEDSDSITIEFR